jgi:exonuclease SbcC
MIPLHLSLSGFLSYREPVSIDFTSFEMACISGPNGAGKSSLLDAITWVLFGQARKNDESIINTQSKSVSVSLIFVYEGNIYRVLRSRQSGKPLLEFQILQEQEKLEGINQLITTGLLPRANRQLLSARTWKVLTERSSSETQKLIETTLRMDYETFVNASFFLQGKADQFTQQRPADRKRILSSILGLDEWELYKKRAEEHARELKEEIARLEGQMKVVAEELAEEGTRLENLQRYQTNLGNLVKLREAQETAIESLRKVEAALVERRKAVEVFRRQWDTTEKALLENRQKLQNRQQERAGYTQQISQAESIETGYQTWQSSRSELERWEAIAQRFRDQEKRRDGPRTEIQTEAARLQGEKESLQKQALEIDFEIARRVELEARQQFLHSKIKDAETRLAQREQLRADLDQNKQEQVERQSDNKTLKQQMDELRERIKRLEKTEGAVCPLCGQPLSPDDRLALIQSLESQGREMGTNYRQNEAWIKELIQPIHELTQALDGLNMVEKELRNLTSQLSQVDSQLEEIEKRRSTWESQSALRLVEIQTIMDKQAYAMAARQRLAEVDAELKEIGYDAAQHDTIRQQENAGRVFEQRMNALERARAALVPLEREIDDLQVQITTQQNEADRQRGEYEQAAAALAQDEAQAPDLRKAETELVATRTEENRLRLEMGAAQQKVNVLDDLKVRQKNLGVRREEQGRLLAYYNQLARAFGKDGVPALLIEHALPQIENQANEILEQLSDGSMSVRFITQSAFKDKNRSDLKETLEIQISDNAGVRDYELYSGGEAFRVNFAIRLALAEVLAQRAGARLQTLVIDEGFGSQDAHGRQRLIEAINLIKPDFAKILVITHIDELKDAFPTRLEVEKTEAGSRVRVISNG